MTQIPGPSDAARATRCARLLVAAILATGTVELWQPISALPEQLPVLRLWASPRAQQRQVLGPMLDFLAAADRLLPRDATILLFTAGRDVRHREYTAFHRALYFLTPRPVWWLTPAPSDGTWESRWWISSPLTRDAVLAAAGRTRATHLLAFELDGPPPVGDKIADLPSGALFALAAGRTAPPPALPPAADGADRPPRLWPIGLLMALGTMVLFGDIVVEAAARAGLRVSRIEHAGLAAPLGAAGLSLALLWLDAVGATVATRVVGLSLLAVGGAAAARRLPPQRRRAPAGAGAPAGARRALRAVLISLLGLGLLLVAVNAVGRPLTVWDSWVLWGMKARTLHLEDGISTALYADPSRAVTLPTYPLLLPSLEAWVYAWVGAADERLAGSVAVMLFAALPALGYAALRRRGASRDFALLAGVALGVTPSLVGLAGAVMADLPVAVFTTIAAIYLVDWLDRRQPGALLVAALAAGVLPWTKREGIVIVVALTAATLIAGRGQRSAWMAALAVGAAALLLSGPWYAFAAWYAVPDLQFSALTPAHFLGHLDRLPAIASQAAQGLASPGAGWTWPAAGIFAVVCRPARHGVRCSDLFILTGLLYVSAMACVYIFSDYQPYQQHMLSSFSRLVAQVTPLPLLWIACRGTAQP